MLSSSLIKVKFLKTLDERKVVKLIYYNFREQVQKFILLSLYSNENLNCVYQIYTSFIILEILINFINLIHLHRFISVNNTEDFEKMSVRVT